MERAIGASVEDDRKTAAMVDSLHRMANVVNADLDRRMIPVLIELLKSGVHPESLAESK